MSQRRCTPTPTLSWALKVVAVAVAYYVCAKGGLAFAFGTKQVTAIWPPTGLALAALLIWGWGMVPGIAIGAMLANATTGEPAISFLGVMVGNTLEAVVAVFLLSRVAGFRSSLDAKRDVVAFVLLAAVVSTLVSATIGVLSLWAGGILPGFVWSVWKTWWLGDMGGDLLVAPVLLVLASQAPSWRGRRPSRARLAETAAVFTGLAGLSVIVFSSSGALAYVLFPVLFWISLRLRQSGAVASSLLASGIAVWFTAHGHGPFVGGSPDANLLHAQTFVGVVALTALLVAAVNSERERAEGSLVRSERLSAELAEAQSIAQIGSWDWDVERGVVRWSPELCRIHGLPPDTEVTFEIWLSMVHEDDRALVGAIVQRAFETAEPCAHEHRAVRPDGEVRVLACRSAAISGPAGRIVRMHGTAHDITDRCDAELLSTGLLDSAPDAMVITDATGRIVRVNARTEALFGYTREELLGEPVTTLVPGGLDPSTEGVPGRHKSGWEFPLEISLSPVRTPHGMLTSASLRDITTRRNAEEALRLAEARFRGAFEGAPIGMALVAPNGHWLRVNPALCEMLGYDELELLRRSFQDVTHPDDLDADLEFVRQMLAGEIRTYQMDKRYFHRRGSEIWVNLTVSLIRDLDGRPLHFVSQIQDITAAKVAQAAQREAEERFRSAFEDAPIGMALSSLSGRFLQVNHALCEMLGYEPEELLATTFLEITHPDDAGGDGEAMRAMIDGTLDHYEREKRYIRANGDPVWISLHATLLRDRDGAPQHFLGQMVDVTQRREFETELRHLADHDPLTGLLNRRGLEAELDRHVVHVNRYGARGALIVLDLDHFKNVNDTLGHTAGDQLIASVAALLRQRLRASDALARLGGDEFAVLLPEADATAAELVAETIVRDIHEHAVVLGGEHPRRVTASLGVTLFRQGMASGEEALVNADLAMYDAKEAGRDRIALDATDRHDQPKIKSRLAWIDRIRAALDEDRFALHAQPIVDLHSGEVRQHELLLRMIGESGDSIPPGAFIYVAERYDLIQEMDSWVALQAIALIERHKAEGRELILEVNVSGKSLGDDRMTRLIESELQRSSIDPAHLIFEVTETAAVANIQLARRFAERLSALGCRFALDDFGAGFGSFYYLKHIPFDYLKIDGEFVTRCTTNRTDQLVIASLVAIAQGLQKETIAEGVEDASTLLFLRRNGVDLAQGYHLGRPAPLADVFDGQRPGGAQAGVTSTPRQNAT